MKKITLLAVMMGVMTGLSEPLSVRSDPADVVLGGTVAVCAQSATTCETRGPYDLSTLPTWFSGMPIGFLLFLK